MNFVRHLDLRSFDLFKSKLKSWNSNELHEHFKCNQVFMQDKGMPLWLNFLIWTLSCVSFLAYSWPDRHVRHKGLLYSAALWFMYRWPWTLYNIWVLIVLKCNYLIGLSALVLQVLLRCLSRPGAILYKLYILPYFRYNVLLISMLLFFFFFNFISMVSTHCYLSYLSKVFSLSLMIQYEKFPHCLSLLMRQSDGLLAYCLIS